MSTLTRGETVRFTTAGTVAGAVGGALGALGGTAVVWRVSVAGLEAVDATGYALADAPATMALVVASVVAIVLGVLIGAGLGTAFGAPMGESLAGKGLLLVVVGGLVGELAVLAGLQGLVAGRAIGMTDFLWTAIVPGLFASPIPALVLAALAVVGRRGAAD